MGKKNRQQGNDANIDFDEAMDQKDESKKFQSLRQLAKKEAEEADKGKASGANQGYSDSDEEAAAAKEKKAKKEKKRKNKGGQAGFDDVEENKEAPQKTEEKAGSDQEQDEDAIQKQLEENFEGVGKKNTRKHKKGKDKEDIFAAGTEKQADLMAAFDDGADSDEMYARKGGKQNKKDKQQGKHKKNKKKDQSDDEEEQPEAEEAKVPEEVKDEAPAGFALEVVYCQKCSCPPEYCAFVEKKDTEECKEWLKNNHADLYFEIYGVRVDGAGATADEPKGETDAAAEEGKEGEEPKPKKKGVKFARNPEKEGIITCYKLKRGSKKTVCQITGMDYYSKDLKSIASKFGKKFSCGCAQAIDEIYGECITVQGDVEYDLWDFLNEDKELKKLAIPEHKVIWEEKGQKKGRKK